MCSGGGGVCVCVCVCESKGELSSFIRISAHVYIYLCISLVYTPSSQWLLTSLVVCVCVGSP